MFKVGQKVMCIKTPKRLPGDDEIFPICGEIYTICSIEKWSGGIAFTFEEIVNKKKYFSDGYGEMNFASRGFRPLESIFGEQVFESLEVMTEPELV